MPEAGGPLSIVWAGHSTVLFETNGVRLLTDPLLRERVWHLRRAVAPAELEGELDAVLISHVHYDHLDIPSLALVRPKRLVVPRGAGRSLERRGFRDVVEIEAGQQLSFGSVSVVATHAEHKSRRSLLSGVSPALGYIVEGAERIYFAGDTDVFAGMRELGGRGLDVALLPVGGWGPRVGPGHMDPRRAAEALALLRPRVAIPIHWGTYRRLDLSRDPETLREPAEQFRLFAAELAPEVDVRVVAPGERFDVRPAYSDRQL